MNKRFFLIAGAFLLSMALKAQKFSTLTVNYVTENGAADGNHIYYKPGQPLTWSDFKGKPVTGSDAAALTSAGFGVKLQFRRQGNNSELIIAVSCGFSKKDSWVLPGSKSDYILNHEQKHFDIAYLNTIAFMQKLRAATFTVTNYASVIEKIYNEAAVNMGKVQDQYDSETSHSRIPEKQALWDQVINRQLEVSAKQ
jgi:hypothetical protein